MYGQIDAPAAWRPAAHSSGMGGHAMQWRQRRRQPFERSIFVRHDRTLHRPTEALYTSSTLTRAEALSIRRPTAQQTVIWELLQWNIYLWQATRCRPVRGTICRRSPLTVTDAWLIGTDKHNDKPYLLLLFSRPRSEGWPLHEQSFAIVFCLRQTSADNVLLGQSTQWCSSRI